MALHEDRSKKKRKKYNALCLNNKEIVYEGLF